jgi:hypothetical protein
VVPTRRRKILIYPCEANNPAVNKRESPGRKKPKNKPDSAKTIPYTPMSPNVSTRNCGLRKDGIVILL